MKSKPDSKKYSVVFWLILICIPLILFVLLETGLRIFDYGDDLSLFKQAEGEKSKYMYLNRWVAKRYFNNQSIPDPTNDVFLKDKPENGYRVFVLGGSTAAGWPYSNNIMFSRILQKRLTDTYPDRYIEVINTSISAISSYTLVDFTNDILDCQPDLVLIYAGHNEFYGALGAASTQSVGGFRWIKKLYLGFVRYKTFQLTKDFIQYLFTLFNTEPDQEKENSVSLMEQLVEEQQIEYGSDLYLKGKAQFADNLVEIFDGVKDAGIPIIISELVSNVRDQAPFKSINTSSELSAGVNYIKSKKLEWAKNFLEAKQQFYRAKDLDALRFRASEEFNEIITTIAAQYGNTVVPMKKYFEENSENELIGNSLMLDHLHPTIDGHFIIADAFYKAITKNNLIPAKKDSGYKKTSEEYRVDWGYSILDSVYANLKIKHLKSGWPFTEKNRGPSSQIFPKDDTIEKIAFRIWKDRSYTSEDGHADLASYFESAGQYENAFHEYNSLTCLKPLNSTAYLKAADVSIKAGNMQRALPFLIYSLKLEKTAFAYKWIGLIQLNNKEIEEAISNLEIVYNLDIKDVELLYNLGLAYYETGKYDLMKKMLEDLKGLGLNDAEVNWMINTLSKLIQTTKEM
jgi:lysophospholipase L1-like esterase